MVFRDGLPTKYLWDRFEHCAAPGPPARSRGRAQRLLRSSPFPALTMTQSDCLFCKLVAGDIPADVVFRSDRVLAFRDISPQAPVHILVIPSEHIGSLDQAGDTHATVLGEVLLTARDLARSEGMAEGGYRTVINTGDDGGQTVHHLHLHLLGGRSMTWPPG